MYFFPLAFLLWPRAREYSGFQVTVIIEWEQKSKPTAKETPTASNKTPKNYPLKISHAEFPSLKSTRKQNTFGSTLFAELRGPNLRALPRIFRLFSITQKNPYLNQATYKNNCRIFLPFPLPPGPQYISSPATEEIFFSLDSSVDARLQTYVHSKVLCAPH